MTQSVSNEELVKRYAAASAEADLTTLATLRHAAWTVDWPQSGERVRGSEAFAAINRSYPGGTPAARIDRIVGAEDRWVVTAGNTVLKIVGSGDYWWCSWVMTYPDGQVYHVVDLLELRDGLVRRETVYWAPPFEAPDWRRPFVVAEDDRD
ncbi:MAG TPA: nuclear transport factor 2 family protein [Candidatus Acidoferrum sp.]|jgi:hypothetical protein|nr:nuclear transport factor 2 family protein [Candidatus Acidoferrum sp.]